MRVSDCLHIGTQGQGGEKFALYRQIPSPREYLLVSQARIRVELYTRGEDGRWTLTDYSSSGDRVPLESLDCSLAPAEIYDKVGR